MPLTATKQCLLLIGFILFLFSKASLAASNWRIDGVTLTPSLAEKLNTKYPEINDLNTAHNLLRDLGNYLGLLSGSVTKDGKTWVYKVEVAKVIKVIDFRLVTRTFRAQLESIAMDFLGHMDAPEVREKLRNMIEELLKDRGFPKPVISFSVTDRPDGVRYRFHIDYGNPCLIESISLTFPLPSDIEFAVRPGDICDRLQIDDALKELDRDLKEEGYTQARYDPAKSVYNAATNSMKVLISGSLGKKVKYEIRDSDKGLLLTDIFAASELEDLDPSLVGPEAMASDIKQRYQARGYDDVQVSGPEVIEAKDDQLTYRFIVTPGRFFRLENIQFQGASAFTRSELINTMDLSTLLSTSTPLNAEKIQSGVESMKSKYRKQGFWDVDIKEPRITKNRESGSAQVLIVIEEGLQRKFAALQVKGNRQLETDDIQELLDIETGSPLDQSLLIDLEKKVRELYLERGYLYIDSTISIDQRAGLNNIFVSVNLLIREGERIKIGDIHITGLVMTDPKVVLRELFFETGDYYDPEVIDASRRAILALGMFQSVQIVPSDRNAAIEQSTTLDLNVQIKESKPGNISFGPGWSLLRGNRFSVESTYSNIGGVGRQIFMRGQISEEAHQKAIGPKTLIGRSLSVGYLEPHLFDFPVNGTASASNSARADDRWQLSTTGELALTHKFRRFLLGSTLSLFYGQKINREVSSDEERIGYLRLLGGNVRTGRVGIRYFYDNRNDITWPSAGFIFSGELSRARFEYGGNLSFRAWQLGYSHYLGITDKTVFALGFSLDSFEDVDRKGVEADVLPQSETLFVGGADTVRGFSERSLGPQVVYGSGESKVLGGSHSAYFKAEIRHKIIGDSVAGTIFADTGNVFFSNTEITSFRDAEIETRVEADVESRIVDNTPYQFEDVLTKPEYIWTKNYAAYGSAINYLTPLGSINLAYGLPWKRCAERTQGCIERGARGKHWIMSGTVHVNIGTQF